MSFVCIIDDFELPRWDGGTCKIRKGDRFQLVESTRAYVVLDGKIDGEGVRLCLAPLFFLNSFKKEDDDK